MASKKIPFNLALSFQRKYCLQASVGFDDLSFLSFNSIFLFWMNFSDVLKNAVLLISFYFHSWRKHDEEGKDETVAGKLNRFTDTREICRNGKQASWKNLVERKINRIELKRSEIRSEGFWPKNNFCVSLQWTKIVESHCS